MGVFEDPPPPRIEGFELLEKIGRGGIGTVYKARELTGGGRTIALKLIPMGQLADPIAEKRFALEARAGEQLKHPDIIDVYASGESGQHLWLAMELLDGYELARVMHESMLGVEDRVSIVSRVAAALEFAHAKDIIHRDVKPSNVFLGRDGNVKLLDFGIAKFRDVKLTKTGNVVGTPSYMSPEQIMGQQVDRRTDVFSLGVLAYELFSGTVPWKRDEPYATVMAICSSPPRPFREAYADNPRFDLSDVVVAALGIAIHRAIVAELPRRFATTIEFANALATAISADAHPKLAPVDPARWSARRIDWARARAARFHVEEPRAIVPAPTVPIPDSSPAPAPTPAAPAPPDEEKDRSNLVWFLLIAVFGAALVAIGYFFFAG